MGTKLDQAVIAALLSISAAAFADTSTPDPSVFGRSAQGRGYQYSDSGSSRREGNGRELTAEADSGKVRTQTEAKLSD
jgi:hypothetical protein